MKLCARSWEGCTLCTNTMHKVADEIESEVGTPLLHIADTTADAILRRHVQRVGLLGTRFTMEEDFYCRRLRETHALDVQVPHDNARVAINDVIYQELCRGMVKRESKRLYLDVIADLVARGAEGVILGCTEIMLLIQQEDVSVPVFDTTTLHALAAVEMSLRGDAPRDRNTPNQR